MKIKFKVRYFFRINVIQTTLFLHVDRKYNDRVICVSSIKVK